MAAIRLPPELTLREQRIVGSLEPVLQVLALEHYQRLKARGVRLRFNSGRRTQAQQDAIVARTEDSLSRADAALELERAGLSGFAAKGKKSLHLFGLAYDGEPDPKTETTWAVYGTEAEGLGLKWGGRWSRRLASGEVRTDRPHVQMPGDGGLRRHVIAIALFGAVVLAIATLARGQLEKWIRG